MKSIAELSGLDLRDREHAEAYYESFRSRIEDLPPFEDAYIPLLRHLANVGDGESWMDFVRRYAATTEHLDRANDWFRAIYPDETGENTKFAAAPDEQIRLDHFLSRVSGNWSADNTDPITLDIYTRLIELASCWANIPIEHDPNVADYIWSRIRCVIAGAGHKFHPQLSELLADAYPQCPFLPDESRHLWEENLLQAHKNCGWPIHIGLLPWKETVACLTEMDNKNTYIFSDWQRIIALLHILKHTAVDETGEWLIGTYRGMASRSMIPQSSTVLGRLKLLATDLVVLLGVPAASKTKTNPMTHAFRWALNHISTAHLRRKLPTSMLPGTILAGPWSTLANAPTENDGFIQHGCRLDGVWKAKDGIVRKMRGETADIVNYDWNLKSAASALNIEARTQFADVLPATYETGYPSDLFFAAFPNIMTTEMNDEIALKCIFDAPIVASLIRSDLRLLHREFPIIAFFPENPTLDESTNQGKTLACLTYVRMLNPGIQSVVVATDSSSAPDNRAIANQIRVDGTAGLDEFRIPRATSHPLSRDHLQVLRTGGSINSGEALKNDPLPLRLRHSLVLAAKAADFGPDLRNSTFPFFLGALTDEHRSHGDTLKKLQSGQLSMQARLGMLALLEQTDFVNVLNNYSHTITSKGVRFGIHRAIARLLYYLRTGAEDDGQIDYTFEHMVAYADKHTEQAENSGVIASIEGNKRINIRLSDFFDSVSELELTAMQGHMRHDTHVNSKGASVTALFAARMNAASMSSQPFYRLLEFLNGTVSRAGNKQICIVLSEEIRRRIRQDEGWTLPGHLGVAGWRLFRHISGRTMTVWLEKVETKLNETSLG